MTEDATAGDGWGDLVATLAQAGIAEPPVPAALRDRIERRDDWLWSTHPIEHGKLYDPTSLIHDASRRIEDYVAIGHVGHGVNSYFLTYQAVVGPLAVFAQAGWGGVYMDAAKQAAEVSRLFAQIGRLLDLAAGWDDPSMRAVVVVSEYKSWDACEIVQIDGRSHARDFSSGPLSAGPITAFDRAAALLDMSDSLGERTVPDAVDVAVRLDWHYAGEVQLVGGRLAFPEHFPSGPGIYRFRFIGRPGPWVYIGESSNLTRRAGNYRIGNPGGVTNAWINRLMIGHREARRTIEVDIALSGTVTAGGESRALALARKHDRVLAESAAIASLRRTDLINKPGVGEGVAAAS